jgi:hypothetical protein
MTNDEIRELAQQAGFRWGFIKAEGLMDGMIDFAKLVAKHEREACVKALEDQIGWDMDDPESTAIKAIQTKEQA